ncbi:MAG: valine--tRNA ligase [Patescibacteria group bacterium]
MKILESQYNPKTTEEKIYKLWEKSGFFNPDNLPGKRTKKFSVMMAPPNITGSLHLGHALENTVVDILVRMKRMMGFKTLWLPGIDHAGIAAQNAVEKELRKQGIRRQDLGREKFIEKIKEWKEKYGTVILGQLKNLGALPDWSRTRYTLDSEYTKAVLEAFMHYYKKGWIYRGERVVNWCPRCGSGISDLEVEYKEEQTKLYFIKYPLTKATSFITVATTRPETMLGDTAVAVNPKDKRYKNLVGKMVILPIQNREIPIIADHSIDPRFGTGAVKVTPAHDVTDFEISLRHNLPKPQIIDENGTMTKEAGAICEGLKTIDCRNKIVEKLQELGLLERMEDYAHNVIHCERCGAVIEPRLSKQWFLKMSELAKLAIKAVKNKEVIITPKKWEKVYFKRLQNERDWNISRQVWWGHQLPIWFHEPKCVPRKGRESGIAECKEFIVSIKEPKCEFCDAKFIQTTDVLDTWFSSALWPFVTLGWPKKTKDLETYYPTDFITSAREILNIWISKMVFSGKEFMVKAPFKTAYIHATILTKEGRRMSKSLGTGINPMELIEKYGSDAARFGLIWQTMGNQDIHWSEEHVIAGKKFCNKIWNASRFAMMNLKDANPSSKLQAPSSKLTAADKKIISGIKKLQKDVEKLTEKYEFGKALHCLYDFFWHRYADIYIETAKKQLADEKLKIPTQNVLLYGHLNLLKLLHPFLPFITEEVWQIFGKLSGSKKLILVENWPA